MHFNGKVYDVLKQIAQLWLPALGTLYFTIAGLWGLPHVTEIIGTITAADTFLGVLLGLSSLSFNKSDAKYDGTMVGETTPTGVRYTLQLNDTPENVVNKSEIALKVVPPAA